MSLFLPPAVFTPPPVDRTPAHVNHVSNHDVQWNRPVFRPPSLPTPAQIWNELPFTARFLAKHEQPK
jgi:hypothetical protein